MEKAMFTRYRGPTVGHLAVDQEKAGSTPVGTAWRVSGSGAGAVLNTDDP